MKISLRKDTIFRIFAFCVLVISPLFLLSEEELAESGWIQEGNILLESKQFEEAELLANSVLGSDPSNSKAEFILTRAWIGIGNEEKKKGNFQKAKEYLMKAYEKWPLNESIRKELAELENYPDQSKKLSPIIRNNTPISSVSTKSMEELTASMNLLRLEIERLKIELETERKEQVKGNDWNWTYLLLGIQIAVLFGIFKKIR
ncbi:MULTISPECIES: lipopolysaccharide assembly protein LapB [unclassified Leptospira]|uniref:tetratricopeptide repeat protein n=1 Tax=unclassified Leptospira TaxID=2633828 RepID=UPI0002C03689|nr:MULTISPECIES: tetratricopeptide repeat protein [unclassified Leptospira]EMJ97416.1 tetratricopeptide repeat protein [Leptospira sp. B5-022]MCR1792756.1 tetratricopeptide repeat protein [Leptospira sp. id769339]